MIRINNVSVVDTFDGNMWMNYILLYVCMYVLKTVAETDWFDELII